MLKKLDNIGKRFQTKRKQRKLKKQKKKKIKL